MAKAAKAKQEGQLKAVVLTGIDRNHHVPYSWEEQTKLEAGTGLTFIKFADCGDKAKRSWHYLVTDWLKEPVRVDQLLLLELYSHHNETEDWDLADVYIWKVVTDCS